LINRRASLAGVNIHGKGELLNAKKDALKLLVEENFQNASSTATGQVTSKHCTVLIV